MPVIIGDDFQPICIKTGVVSPSPPWASAFRAMASRMVDRLPQPQPACFFWGTWLLHFEGTQTSRSSMYFPQLIVMKNHPLFSHLLCVFFPKIWHPERLEAFNTLLEGPQLGVFNQGTLKITSSKGHWTPPKWCPWSKKAKTYQKMSKLRNFQTGQVWCYCWCKKILLTSWYGNNGKSPIVSSSFVHLRWLFGISEPSTVWLWIIWKYRWTARGSLDFMSMFKEDCKGKLCDTWWKRYDKCTFRIFSRRILQMYFLGFTASNADL